MVIGRRKPSVTFTYAGTTTAAGDHTYTGVAVGPAHPKRKIIAVIGYIGGVVVPSVTIGGVAATKAVGASQSGWRCELWWAEVPTGTTANIVISDIGGTWLDYCATYAVVGLKGASPSATSSDTVSPASMVLDVPTFGIVVAGVYGQGTGSINLVWSGATADTEQETITTLFGSAHHETVSALPAHAVSASTGLGLYFSGVSLSWT